MVMEKNLRESIENAVKEYRTARSSKEYEATEIWANMDTMKIWVNKYRNMTDSVNPNNRFEIRVNDLVNSMDADNIEKAITFFNGKNRTEIETYINLNGRDYLNK